MTGTTIAQAIPLAISPILTRIYTPDDFGVLGLFLAISSITGAVATGRYEQAILLPEKKENALVIVKLCFLASLVLSFFLLIVIVLFSGYFAGRLGNEEIRFWLFLVPFATLSLGFYNTLNYYNLRLKQFKNVSKSQILRSTTLGISQVVIGLIKSGALGLITGQIISYVSGISILSNSIPNLRNNLKKITWTSIKEQAKLYVKFPKFSLPSTFVNTTTLNLTPILISSFFSMTTLGFYSLSLRIIGVPSRVLGNSFSQVFYQKATEMFNNNNKVEPIFVKTLLRLLMVGVPPFLILYFFVEPIFEIVFGVDWKISGTYAKILIPLAASRFVSSSMSPITNIMQKQHISLMINVALLLTTIALFFYAKNFSVEFNLLLRYLTFSLGFIYIFGIMVYWYIVRQSDKNK